MQQLSSLETQLNTLASQLTQTTTNFKNSNSLVTGQTIKNTTGINNYLNDLNNTNDEIKNFPTNLNNILNDSDIFVLQQNYDYLFWTILASGVVLVSMNILK